MEISVPNMSVLESYVYIKYIGKISINILTKISVERKLFKSHRNTWKTLKKNNKISKNILLKIIL